MVFAGKLDTMAEMIFHQHWQTVPLMLMLPRMSADLEKLVTLINCTLLLKNYLKKNPLPIPSIDSNGGAEACCSFDSIGEGRNEGSP